MGYVNEYKMIELLRKFGYGKNDFVCTPLTNETKHLITIKELQNIVNAVYLTKDLINEPFSHLTAKDLAKHAVKSTIKYGIKNTVYNKMIKDQCSKNIVNHALSFTRNLMLNKFFLPNNLYLPKSRVFFENCFS